MSNIDEFFKDNLDNHGMRYDDSYWNEMEKLLDKKKRKRAVLYFSVLTSLLLVAVVGIFMFYRETDAIQKPVAEKGIISQVNSDNKRIDIAEEPKEGLADSKQETMVLKNDKKEHKPISDGEVKSKTSVKNNFTLPPQKEINLSGLAQTNYDQPAAEASTKDFDEEQSKPEDRIALKGFIPMTKTENDPEISLIAFNPEHNKKKPVAAASGLPKDSSKLNAKWQYFIAPGYEYDKYSRTENNAPLKKDEKTMNTSGVNLNFIAKKNNLGFKTGCGILQLSEMTNYNIINKSYSFDTSYRMIDAYYKQSSTGSRIALIKRDIDTTVTESSGVDNPDSRATFTYFKIPLMATYEFRFHKLGFYINAGINTSFLIQKKGDYTTFDESSYSLQDVRESNDFNKVLFQTYTAIGINYHFSNSFSIYGGYGYSKSLNSMVKSYSQKPNINLLTLGLEIKL